MKKILVIETLNFFSLLVSIWFRINRSEVYIFEQSNFSAFDWWIEFLSIKKCDFSLSNDLNPSSLFGHDGDEMDKTVDEICLKEFITTFSRFFPKVNNIEKKQRILVKKYILYRCNKLNKLSIWIEGNFSNKNHKIYLAGSICKIKESYIHKKCKDVNLVTIFPTNAVLIFDLISRVNRKIIGASIKYLRKTNIKKQRINKNSIINDNIDKSQYSVLFFPHKSIFYGDIFLKNHFYSNNINSEFHPSKILHIEFSNVFLNEIQSNYYYENQIKTIIFQNKRKKELLLIFLRNINKIGLLTSCRLIMKNYVLFFILLSASVRFLSSKNSLEDYSSAKIALVGYEILFPPILAMALESIEIRTVSIQERFMAASFYSNFGFIVDSYLCNSVFSLMKIKNSINKEVNNFYPVGQPRTDLLFELQKDKYEEDNIFTILVYDYHSENDIEVNRLEPIVNWKANKAFYSDICNLAVQFPETRVIIRGKDTKWTNIKFFDDVLSRIEKISNIFISNDFDEIGKQYKLGANADLVIAKHTSIADELITIGKEIIFYDFLPNAKKVISYEFNYKNTNIFAYSYNELIQMTEKVINGQNLLSKSQLIELQHVVNNGAADGKVKSRIETKLNEFLKDE
jgi:hypothetical protein